MHNARPSLPPGTIFGFILPCLVFGLLLIVFSTCMLWRIFKKTGQHGALSLLGLIPGIGFYLVLAILAFGKWSLKTEESQRHMSDGVMPPAAATQDYSPQR